MGPVKAVFLNSLDVVLEAMVKKKADFADRPNIKSCKIKFKRWTSKGKGRPPSTSDRPNLFFTEAFIMETMRMEAVGGFGLPHSTLCDSSVGGYDIPKSAMVFINQWALHNDPKFWKEVDKFDPYRYLTKDGKMDMKPESWLPFSAGRRICLEEPVARTELLLIATNLLKTFRFSAPSGVKHEANPKFVSQGVELPVPFKVVIEKRTN